MLYYYYSKMSSVDFPLPILHPIVQRPLPRPLGCAVVHSLSDLATSMLIRLPYFTSKVLAVENMLTKKPQKSNLLKTLASDIIL